MSVQGNSPNLNKEFADLVEAQNEKVKTQHEKFEDLGKADQKVRKETEYILQVVQKHAPDNQNQLILEALEEYAKLKKISLLAAKTKVLQYLSPEWKEKVDTEVKEYFLKFNLSDFAKLPAGSEESNEAIDTLKILCNEGYMPYFVIAVRYDGDPEKEDTLQRYETFTKTIKTTLKEGEQEALEAKEKEVLSPENTFPEARKYIENLKTSQKKGEYKHIIELAYRYLILGIGIRREFAGCDCNDSTLLLQKTALDEGLEIGNYMKTDGHAVLRLDGFPLVLDTFDMVIRTVEECAKQEGYGENSHGSYFWKDKKEEHLAQYEDGGNLPKKIIGYKKIENNPCLIKQDEDISQLIIDRVLFLKSQGRNEEIGIYYEKVLEINPNSTEAHCNFAVLLKSQGRNEEAELHYEKALQINPNNAEAHNNFANLLDSVGEKRKAITHYEAALEINPNQVKAHYNIAVLLYDIGDFANSRKHLTAFDGLRKGRHEDYFKDLDERLRRRRY